MLDFTKYGNGVAHINEVAPRRACYVQLLVKVRAETLAIIL